MYGQQGGESRPHFIDDVALTWICGKACAFRTDGFLPFLF